MDLHASSVQSCLLILRRRFNQLESTPRNASLEMERAALAGAALAEKI